MCSLCNLLINVENFVERACVRYLRKGYRLKQRCLQKLNNGCLNAVQSTFHMVLCLLYTYWDIHHHSFASLLFQMFPKSNFRNVVYVSTRKTLLYRPDLFFWMSAKPLAKRGCCKLQARADRCLKRPEFWRETHTPEGDKDDDDDDVDNWMIIIMVMIMYDNIFCVPCLGL